MVLWPPAFSMTTPWAFDLQHLAAAKKLPPGFFYQAVQRKEPEVEIVGVSRVDRCLSSCNDIRQLDTVSRAFPSRHQADFNLNPALSLKSGGNYK